MTTCTHRITARDDTLCSHPSVHLPGQVVLMPAICERCDWCDGGQQLYDPRDLRGARIIGVGSHLKRIFRELGIEPKAGCTCDELIRQMNKLGPSGCRERVAKLVKRIDRNRSKLGIEVPDGVDAREFIRPLVEEAIRRAEVAEREATERQTE